MIRSGGLAIGTACMAVPPMQGALPCPYPNYLQINEKKMRYGNSWEGF